MRTVTTLIFLGPGIDFSRLVFFPTDSSRPIGLDYVSKVTESWCLLGAKIYDVRTRHVAESPSGPRMTSLVDLVSDATFIDSVLLAEQRPSKAETGMWSDMMPTSVLKSCRSVGLKNSSMCKTCTGSTAGLAAFHVVALSS